MFKKSKPLKDPTDYDHAYNYALFLLNLSMRTTGEIKDKMRKRGYIDSVINKVLTVLEESKYVDDNYYAEVFINNAKSFKNWGKYNIRQKMFEKKLPVELIEQQLSQFLSENDEIEIATKYVTKNFGSLEDVKNLEYKDKQKIYNRLSARGFGLDIIKQII